MPTYIYECPVHKEFEVEHSINDKLETCPQCEAENSSDLIVGQKREPQKVKRLIAKSSFVLVGGGWAKDNYS